MNPPPYTLVGLSLKCSIGELFELGWHIIDDDDVLAFLVRVDATVILQDDQSMLVLPSGRRFTGNAITELLDLERKWVEVGR